MSNVTSVVLAHSPVQIELTCVDDHNTHNNGIEGKKDNEVNFRIVHTEQKSIIFTD